MATLAKSKKQKQQGDYYARHFQFFDRCADRHSTLDSIKEILPTIDDINWGSKRKWYEESCLIMLLVNKKLDIVKYLLEHRSDIDLDVRNAADRTALTIATLQDYKDIVKLLLQKGANINKHAKNAYTPLMYAVEKNNADLVKLFLQDKNINLNLRNENGKSALHLATEKGLTDIIEMLLNDERIDPYITDYRGLTAYDIAVKLKKKYPDVAQLFDGYQRVHTYQEARQKYNFAKNIRDRLTTDSIKHGKKQKPKIPRPKTAEKRFYKGVIDEVYRLKPDLSRIVNEMLTPIDPKIMKQRVHKKMVSEKNDLHQIQEVLRHLTSKGSRI
jgi:hypothetical protein